VFSARSAGPADASTQIIEMADELASGGSLSSPADDPAVQEGLIAEREERALFVAEAREHIAQLRGKTGRRRVQLDDDLLMSLHTFVGSSHLVAQGVLVRIAELLYEVARAARVEVLRGPNVEVDVARLFQESTDFLEHAIDRIESGADSASAVPESLLEQAQALLRLADTSPSEGTLLGLAQLDVVLHAPQALDVWRFGPAPLELTPCRPWWMQRSDRRLPTSARRSLPRSVHSTPWLRSRRTHTPYWVPLANGSCSQSMPSALTGNFRASMTW
jgi:hypothetical protein